MDYSQYRRSDNIEDARNEPLSLGNLVAGALGMSRGPWDTLTDAAKSLRYPFTPLPLAAFDGRPSPAGSMSEQIGRNDLLKMLRENPGIVDLIEPGQQQINPHRGPVNFDPLSLANLGGGYR